MPTFDGEVYYVERLQFGAVRDVNNLVFAVDSSSWSQDY